jgi:hypothetical protein
VADERVTSVVERLTGADTVSSPVPIGVKSQDVIHYLNEKYGNVTLDKFIENYMAYAKEAELIHCGDDEPTNPNVVWWIDTSDEEPDEDEE